MFKKLLYAFLLSLAFIITACGSGVATYPPPDKTKTFEAALSSDVAPAGPTEQAALPTEPSVETIESTAIQSDDETITLEAEIESVEAPATPASTDETLVPSDLPPTDVEALPSEEATELPDTPPTEAVPTSRAEVVTIAPTDTSIPTVANTPEPTATSTPLPTDTLAPTATSTSTSTNTPEPTATSTPTATNTPEPTATSTATDTPIPTATPTSTPTDTPEPTTTPTSTFTDTPEPTPTATSTATDTPEPTVTATSTPTDTLEPTSTPTSTATDTPEPTTTPTSTSTNTLAPTATPTSTFTNTPEPTDTPTATFTSTPEPVELEPYENESLGLTFDYSPVWSEPIEDDNAIIIIPSEDIEDTSAGNVTILRGRPDEIADEFVVEVDTASPETFLESLTEDLEEAEISELELENIDFEATELIGVVVEDNQTIRTIVIDLEDDWIVIIGSAPTENFEVFSVDVMDAILQNLEITERTTPEPVESTQYEGEAVGLEFDYQEDSEIQRVDNTLTIESTIDGVTGNIFIARGTPEDLLDQGHIGDDSNPRAALLSLEPESDPFVSDQFNPSFQAWTITIETDDEEARTERLYIVAIRTEWVFIRTSALTEDFEEANEKIFALLLESIIILDEIPE